MEHSCCGTDCAAVLTQEMKDVISQSAFIPVASVSREGQPHLIVVGKVKEILPDDTLVLGVYKMVRTRQNLAQTGVMQLAAVAGKKGFRFSGQGRAEDEKVIFKVEKAEALL
ncbi:MAG: pyridoxamine 5'-phosphate oxidase family protein [Actinobacteria bacterium]|nr:pyridoxamine 5'-phosphate oxidase family protein [Actinomycetota bacterium]